MEVKFFKEIHVIYDLEKIERHFLGVLTTRTKGISMRLYFPDLSIMTV